MEKQFQNDEDMGENSPMEKSMIDLAKKLEDEFCQNISVYKVTPIFSYTDYVIIATTISDIQRRGIIQMLPQLLQELSLDAYIEYCINRSQLSNTGGWVLLDFKDFIVHLMTQELREFYEIDKMFFETKNIYM